HGRTARRAWRGRARSAGRTGLRRLRRHRAGADHHLSTGVRHRDPGTGPRGGVPRPDRRQRGGNPMRTAYLGLEAKRALRNPRFLMFTSVFPVVIYVIDVSAFGKGNVPGRNDVPYTALLMVSLAAFGAFMAAMNTGARTAVERSAGWQRQLRLTPLK